MNFSNSPTSSLLGAAPSLWITNIRVWGRRNPREVTSQWPRVWAGWRGQSILTRHDLQHQVDISSVWEKQDHNDLDSILSIFVEIFSSPPETTTTAYSRRTTRTSYDNRQNEIKQSSDKKYFKPKKSSYYDPFSFQSTERSPTVEKYLKYKNSQKNKNIYSNRLDSRFSIQVDNNNSLHLWLVSILNV